MAHDLGQTVNALGCLADKLTEDTMITDIVVLCKTVKADGTVTLFMSHSAGMSWIERFGMLHGAVAIEDHALRERNQ